MAKSKIIWSARAKKSLYSILEFYIRRDKRKSYAKGLYKIISKKIRILLKHPYTGVKTNEESVYGLSVESFILFYESYDNRIVIHTISEKQ